MVEINVNLPIGGECANKWTVAMGGEPMFFSLEAVKRIFAENESEQDFRFNFNCDGGYVHEGLAIYDAIRTSGKNIYCNIEGGCHSMAVVMLLAAPIENRTANPNCRALIHNVRGEIYGDMTAAELESMAEDMRREEGAILDIYADRTGKSREELQALMDEEKMRSARELLDWGFIGHINSYNTNLRKGGGLVNKNTNPSKKDNMAKSSKEVMDMLDNAISAIRNLLGVQNIETEAEPTNYDHTDADGNVLFTTEAEDEALEVGMPATPDGTFELPDGRTVVIAEGVIAEIKEPAAEEPEGEPAAEPANEGEGEGEEPAEEPQAEPGKEEELKAEIEELKAELAKKEAELAELTENLKNALNAINEAKTLCSNYKPANAARTATAKTPEEVSNYKEEMRAKLGISKKC